MCTTKKALFLDRDGIVNIDYGYVYKIEDFTFIEGIFELVSLFQKAGYLIFIVTNQSGIGRGYYTESDFQTLSTWVKKQFVAHHIEIDEIYHCPHTPEAKCHCRKPQTGMIEACLKHYNIDLEHSYMIGDKPSDMAFAKQASIGNRIAIATHPLTDANYTFASILQCKHFFEENQGKILL
jgi:D-glycero-D-manno-heptose 1,7-bisphosphate phosphatase